MNQNSIPDFRHYLADWSDELELLRQNRLLDESSFIRFASDRGIPVSGVIRGDPSDFCRRGWLNCDGSNYDGGPLFHPYRIYPLDRILEACRLKIAASSSLQRENFLPFLEQVVTYLPTVEQLAEVALSSNQVVDLAILLEPIYWPRITHRSSMPFGIDDLERQSVLEQYHQRIVKVIEALDSDYWQKAHERLRVRAASMDPNNHLYILVRLSTWQRREELKGHISGALWLRHIAEMIRLAFEEVHSVCWFEEDQAFGTWFPGSRKLLLGSERPLEDELECKPYVAWFYGLFTSSILRWYVEGETEYYAIHHLIPELPKFGIEVVNLRGVLESDKDNIALKLADWLQEDQKLRRFSMVSFDRDVSRIVEFFRRQIRQDRIVGSICANAPDFEFANFTLPELVEIAARLDEAKGYPGCPIRDADWTGIRNGADFEKRYGKVSATQVSKIKNRDWGRALAAYAVEYPNRDDDGKRRPFLHEIDSALGVSFANYDWQKEHLTFDPNTFQLIERQPPAGTQNAVGTGFAPQ